jgi:hypothetical protein
MFIERYARVFPSQRDSHLYVTPVTTLHSVQQHPEIIGRCRHHQCNRPRNRWTLQTLTWRAEGRRRFQNHSDPSSAPDCIPGTSRTTFYEHWRIG